MKDHHQSASGSDRPQRNKAEQEAARRASVIDRLTDLKNNASQIMNAGLPETTSEEALYQQYLMDEDEVEQENVNSWFTELFLNNKAVTALLIILLVLLVIWVFSQVSYLFDPVVTFANFIGFPVITAVIFFYLFEPIVNKFTQRGFQRGTAIITLFVIVVLLITWGISTLVPILQRQGASFVKNLPVYVETLNNMLEELPMNTDNFKLAPSIREFFDGIDITRITNQLESIITSTFGGIGSVIGTLSEIVAGLLTMPVILYYLLMEGDRIPRRVLYYVPDKYRNSVSRILFKANYQVSQYIRGQILVALIVAIMFAIGYTVIGLDYAISLAVISGFLNIIPYLGSIIAVVPALIIGLITSPYMLLKVIIVLMIEQFIEGRFVSPQVLGSNMKIHPVTILMILLGAGKLFGVTGVIVGVPVYAVVKVIIGEIYQAYRQQSNLYTHDEYLPGSPGYETLVAPEDLEE